MNSGKLYQDPIYGAKVLSPLAVRIIDTPEFQRLAGLKQLGFADMVYRGAHHTRFEHSVGTYFICRTIMRRIVQNHDRLDLDHPGKSLPRTFSMFPKNAEIEGDLVTYQSKWRGLTETVSIAALLHDIGHVPFGHTLEDEFVGRAKKHDGLAGPRLYAMLFDPASDLADVFCDTKPWVGSMPNEILRRLIYLILSWKEDVEKATGFSRIVADGIGKAEVDSPVYKRLCQLRDWHSDFVKDHTYQPFMTDIIGDTICSDLLDYLPRDRTYLGMEARNHSRLQRYFTIRSGTHYEDEGLRMSIMVTRRHHGGQRRDVATAVLDIMRERYEMAERVYYHHKKAAASSLLAKLFDITPEHLRPRDNERIYPAPWTSSSADPPHMVHLTDFGLINYLGQVSVLESDEALQHRLHAALTFRRKDVYRTLLVVDYDLPDNGTSTPAIVNRLRGSEDRPDPTECRRLEESLERVAEATRGAVIIYCPSPSMQSKEINARLEIQENQVRPLSSLTSQFTYNQEIGLLRTYYVQLWRAYIFVSPELFVDAQRCKAVVDEFCRNVKIEPAAAYKKVRGHDVQNWLNEQPKQLAPLPGQMSILEIPAVVPPQPPPFVLGSAPLSGQLQQRMQFSSTLERALKVALPGRKTGPLVREWIEKNSRRIDSIDYNRFLAIVEATEKYQPTDLWAARGSKRALGDRIVATLLDTYLFNLVTEAHQAED